MTSTSARSGMPGHFGIRIAKADKDKLVGELDVDDRHLNNSGHVHVLTPLANRSDLLRQVLDPRAARRALTGVALLEALKIVVELGVSGFDELGQSRPREIAILAG